MHNIWLLFYEGFRNICQREAWTGIKYRDCEHLIKNVCLLDLFWPDLCLPAEIFLKQFESKISTSGCILMASLPLYYELDILTTPKSWTLWKCQSGGFTQTYSWIKLNSHLPNHVTNVHQKDYCGTSKACVHLRKLWRPSEFKKLN